MRAINEKHQRAKDHLVEIAVTLIDKCNGSVNINMRTVAKEAGCAHTNVYNYFDSYADLLYAALMRTIEKLMAFTQAHVGTVARAYEHFSAFIDAQIEFAIQYPGLYRFFWLEELPEPVPPIVLEKAKILPDRFAALVINCSEARLTQPQAAAVSDILHAYLHGEICKMISNRNVYHRNPQDKERIIDNVDRLMHLLFEAESALPK